MKHDPRHAITANHMPPVETVLESDLAFHLGSFDSYQFAAIAEACAGKEVPWGAFVCFNLGMRHFVSGDFYRDHYAITDTTIERRGELGSFKQVRTIETITRDFSFFDPSLYYCYDLQDARHTDYAKLFGTEKSIPVFQYHRRKDLSAIIIPLYVYHEHPSWNIPKLIDQISFAQKRPKAFWRGDLSGELVSRVGFLGTHAIANHDRLTEDEKIAALRQSTRFRICQDHSSDEMVDAGLVIKWGSPEYPAPIAFLQPLCRPRVSHQDHLYYRYLLALDGYDGPSSWYWMLGTNSLVLRQESQWEMFGDNYFHPWIHFVPLALDGSDLTEKLSWCEHHTSECAKMVDNAHAAWAVLFDPQLQIERRRALFATYNRWAQTAAQ